MDFNLYVKENLNGNLNIIRKENWAKTNNIYNNILDDTIQDIKKMKKII